MPTVFTRILRGELPGRFVWKDKRCAAFLSINPLRPGHVLVVPRDEIDHWLDVPASLRDHLFGVAQSIGRALQAEFKPEKVGLVIVGLEVLHVHLHVVPIWGIGDLDFARAEKNPAPAALDEAAARVRAALRRLGYAQASD
jgi:diadenosine tetraphosphate (Ap4A) HIT family hydrolase